MANNFKIFGERLRSYRNQADLSQENLAEKSGLHSTYIRKLERGAFEKIKN